MAGFASALRELKHQPEHWKTPGRPHERPQQRQLGETPGIVPCFDQSLRNAVPGVLQGRVPPRFSLVDCREPHSCSSSCSGQPLKMGNRHMVQPPPASKPLPQHCHSSGIEAAVLQADVDSSLFWNEEPTLRLGGSCTVPVPAKQVVEPNMVSGTRSALLQVDQDVTLIGNRGHSPHLGGSCSVPAPAEEDIQHSDISCTRSALLQADVDSSLCRRAPTPKANTWPLLTGSHMSNLGRCGGQLHKTDHVHCRSVSDGVSMPRLLLTPSSLNPVEAVDRFAARISAEDGSSTTEPGSSSGDAFSEFLEGDPWEGCEELAAQGLAEWYRDFLGNRFGQQKAEAELPLSEEPKSSVDQPAHLLPRSALQRKPPQRLVSAAW